MRAHGWSAALHDAFLLLLCYGINRAPRLDEVPTYRRSNFGFAITERSFVSAARASAAGPIPRGTLLRAAQVPSKTDRSGQKWCGKFLYYHLDEDSELSFAAEWARYELKYPCGEEQRGSWAAFSPD